MKMKLWKEEKGEKYKEEYLESLENIWWNGDFEEWKENGGIVINGR